MSDATGNITDNEGKTGSDTVDVIVNVQSAIDALHGMADIFEMLGESITQLGKQMREAALKIESARLERE